MALSLLSINTCVHPGCGLHFANMYDLIAHIEFTHIPVTEQTRQRSTSASEREEARPNAPNLPLSCFQRVFSSPYSPTPCSPEIFKISFNHYRKRNHQGNAVTGNALSSKISTPRDDELSNEAPSQDDLDECSINDHEMRFRCHYVDCNKRYKNAAGLRLHMKTAHGLATDDDSSNSNNADCVMVTNGSQGLQTSSPKKNPASRPFKCTHCSKRYKTVQGLQNHMHASHQKHSDTNDPPSPSPAVVAQLITQARAHGLNQQAAQAQAIAERVALVQHRESPSNVGNTRLSSVSQAAPHQYSVPNGALPVRSIHVTNRVVTQTHSMTTGQLLQQQIRDQRRVGYSQAPHPASSSTSVPNEYYGRDNAAQNTTVHFDDNQLARNNSDKSLGINSTSSSQSREMDRFAALPVEHN